MHFIYFAVVIFPKYIIFHSTSCLVTLCSISCYVGRHSIPFNCVTFSLFFFFKSFSVPVPLFSFIPIYLCQFLYLSVCLSFCLRACFFPSSFLSLSSFLCVCQFIIASIIIYLSAYLSAIMFPSLSLPSISSQKGNYNKYKYT